MIQPWMLPTNDFWNRLLKEIQHNIGNGVSEYNDVLAWVFEKIGIKHFSYVYVGYLPSETDEAIILGNYPQEWVEIYRSRALFRHDPIIKFSSKTSTTFFWEEAVESEVNTKHIFEMSTVHGIDQGFTVPIHEPGCAFGSMHFAESKDNSDFPEIVKRHSHLLSSVSYFAHQYRPAIARQGPCERLTKREVECLNWVAMGKSYGEIALILNISERTVKYHANNIISKMEAVNIKQAMTKALRMNWI